MKQFKESKPSASDPPIGGTKSSIAKESVISNLTTALSLVEKVANVAKTVPLIAPVASLLSEILKTYSEVKDTHEKRDKLLADVTEITTDLCGTILRMEATNHVDLIGRLKADIETYASLVKKAHAGVTSFDGRKRFSLPPAEDDDGETPAPAPAPAPATPTYADVAAPHVTRAYPQSAPLPPVTRGDHPNRPSAPRLANPPTKVSKQHKAASRPSVRRNPRHSPHRLILRWTASPPTIDHRAPVTALAALLDNATLEHHSPSHIQGVNWTSSGNLVIHTCAPYTASQLAAVHGEAVKEIVKRECGQFLGLAVLEADYPWVPVVVHGVPAQALVESLKFEQEDVWTALKGTGNGPAEVKAVRVLCRDEDMGKRQGLSLRLTFSDVDAANRILSDGAFFFGTHCRVSRYRPRPRVGPRLPT
ncbi:hypothetical protein B0H13DRAFT_2302733 [Mycena leptocephala]|nr:hypothetical protein B0H13DRAFT_2302733 [Mycena leptocephala]